jgi:DNA-binding transcriptional LysR family regulator
VLNITQPAVSQHIHYLENEYGVKLFSQEGKKLLITDSGKLLYKKMDQI